MRFPFQNVLIHQNGNKISSSCPPSLAFYEKHDSLKKHLTTGGNME